MKNFKNIIFSTFISALLILSISQPSANALSSWGYELSSGSSLSSWGSSHRIFDTKNHLLQSQNNLHHLPPPSYLQNLLFP